LCNYNQEIVLAYLRPLLSEAFFQGRNESVYDTFAMHCRAEHAKSVPSDLHTVIKRSARSTKALRALQAVVREDKDLNNLVSTTQAIDIIHGGVKSDVLPERAWAIFLRKKFMIYSQLTIRHF
jgi:Gly-Xaa carboxypeptidase